MKGKKIGTSWNKGKKTGLIPWNKGKKGMLSQEAIDSIRRANTGRKQSAETVMKRSKSLMGRIP
jgi:hypothetical protein